MSSLFWGFGLGLFLYIQPLYIAHLGATPEQIGLVLASSGLAVTLLYIPIGLWADRRGRKPVILAGWGLGAVATLAMALAPDWRWLIPAQAAYLLSNFAVPAMNGYIAAGSGGNPARMFALVTSTSSLGSILSPTIGGWIGEQFGLRVVYVCAAVAFGLSTWALWNLSGQPGEPAPAYAGAAPRQLLTNPYFLWQVIFILLVFFAIDLGQVMAPNFLEQVRGLSLSQIGRLGTAGSIGIVTLTLLFGRMPAERRRALVLAQAAAMLAVLILLKTGSLVWITLAYFIHGSNRVVRPILAGRLVRSLDPATLSFGFGFLQTAMQLGLTFSPYVAGMLYAHNPAWPMYAGILGLSGTMLLAFVVPVPLPEPARAAVV